VWKSNYRLEHLGWSRKNGSLDDNQAHRTVIRYYNNCSLQHCEYLDQALRNVQIREEVLYNATVGVATTVRSSYCKGDRYSRAQFYPGACIPQEIPMSGSIQGSIRREYTEQTDIYLGVYEGSILGEH